MNFCSTGLNVYCLIEPNGSRLFTETAFKACYVAIVPLLYWYTVAVMDGAYSLGAQRMWHTVQRVLDRRKFGDTSCL